MNLQPPGYEPDELPGCSTPRYVTLSSALLLYNKYPRKSIPFLKKVVITVRQNPTGFYSAFVVAGFVVVGFVVVVAALVVEAWVVVA